MPGQTRTHLGILILVSIFVGASFSMPGFALASGLPNECPGALEDYNVIEGTGGTDMIEGTTGNDFIDAKGGDNVVNGNGGDDCIVASGGDDQITTGDGNDVIIAGDGKNVIVAGGGDNFIETKGDDDHITTGSGNDTIEAGDGKNTIEAGEGNNTIETKGKEDTITTGGGDDRIEAGDGDNVVNAGDGNNFVETKGGGDRITTGAGDDEIEAGDGENIVIAGDGNNEIETKGGNDDITTGSGDDSIEAGDGENVINSGDGNDTIETKGGRDIINAGAGDDTIESGGNEEDDDATDDGAGCDVIDGNPSVCGYAWSDINGDGVKDDIESLLAGWTIALFGDDGETSTATDSSGFFEFKFLENNKHYVACIKPSSSEEGSWFQTRPFEEEDMGECDEDYFEKGYDLELENDERRTGVDFGNYEIVAPAASPAAGNYTWPQDIVLSAVSSELIPGFEIFYTTDGTIPGCAPQVGTPYKEGSSIPLKETTTVKAITCYEDGSASPVGEYPYAIEIELTPDRLPELVTKGIFVQTEAATSTPAVVQVTQEVVLSVSVSGTNGTSTVALPEDVVISRADGENLDVTLLTATEMATSSLSNLGSATVFEGALQWGMASASLQFSAPITLSIYVGEALNGQTLDIMRSPDGTSGWTADGIVSPATCTVTNGICTFQATKASVYAAARPPVVSSGSGGGGGGGFTDTTPPGSPAVSIVVASEIATGTITLSLSAEDAYEMIVADNPDFSGAAWERYGKKKPWMFVPENGKTTAYAKFRDVSNNETAPVSATWSEALFVSAPAPTIPQEEAAVASRVAAEEPAADPAAPAEGSDNGASAETVSAVPARYAPLRYEVAPTPPAPPLLAALDSVFGTAALNFSLVMLSSLFGAVFYGAYDLIRARFF